MADLSRSTKPWLLLTGDSLLVGDLARPDLVLVTEAGATTLHSSVKQLLALGDHVEVSPRHVGGSLCGGAGLSRKTSTTIGFERRHNPLLLVDQDDVVHGLLESIPPRPPNVDRIVELNRAASGEPADARPLDATELRELLSARVTVLDARRPPAFDAGHLAGAVNLPVSSAGVGTRAGWSLAPEEPIVIAADDSPVAHAMASALQAVALWQLAGYTVGDELAWKQLGLPVAEARSLDVEQVAGSLRRDAVDLVESGTHMNGRRARPPVPPRAVAPPATGPSRLLAGPRENESRGMYSPDTRGMRSERPAASRTRRRRSSRRRRGRRPERPRHRSRTRRAPTLPDALVPPPPYDRTDVGSTPINSPPQTGP